MRLTPEREKELRNRTIDFIVWPGNNELLAEIDALRAEMEALRTDLEISKVWNEKLRSALAIHKDLDALRMKTERINNTK